MENLLLESRQHGWANAESAPAHIRERIISIRSAFLDGKPAPAPTSFYVTSAEQRNLTLPRIIERKLFPVFITRQEMRADRKSSLCFEARIEKRNADQRNMFRARAAKQAAVIAAAAPRKLTEDEQREIRNERRRCFPWEN